MTNGLRLSFHCVMLMFTLPLMLSSCIPTDNDGDAESAGRFSTPSAALYSLNDAAQRRFPERINTGFSGNGHAETWDGRVFVTTRGDGWYVGSFRPEKIKTGSSGIPDFKSGAFGNFVPLELNSEAPDIHHNWLSIVPDPEVSGENPFPSDAAGNYQLNGTYQTYLTLVYHSKVIKDLNNYMGMRKARFIVKNAKTENAEIEVAEFTTEFRHLTTALGVKLHCIEPSATFDGRLIICQGAPNNLPILLGLVYTWNVNAGAESGWTIPKSISSIHYVDRNKEIDGVSFSVRYPIAQRPLLDARGQAYKKGELIFGAYPWISHDGAELFYQASLIPDDARRTGATVLGRWTGWAARHIDGPINNDRFLTKKLFISSPGAFTTMWSPYKDIVDLPIPYSVRGPSYPLFGSNTNDYMEVGFDDFLDGNYVLYLSMNELLTRLSNYDVDTTPDTSGNFNNAKLIKAKFPKEYNGQDEIIGRFGQAIYFPAGAYLDVMQNQGWDTLGKEGVTIDFFVKKQNGNGPINLFQLGNKLSISLGDGQSVISTLTTPSGGVETIRAGSIVDGKWAHIACTYNPFNSLFRLYVDGELVAESTVAEKVTNLNAEGGVFIGPKDSKALLIIDEFKVSNVARRQYEIAHNAYVRSHRSVTQRLNDAIPDHFADLRRHSFAVDQFSQAAAQLGERLFSDTILSKQRTTSCLTCHDTALNFTDGNPLAQGNEPTDAGKRNAPTLMNRLFSSFQGWSGEASSLDTQALIPVAAQHEMNLPITEAIQRLSNDAFYLQQFKNVFGEAPNDINFPIALASFQALQFSPRSRVDDYKSGDVSALSASERRGLLLFEGKARCSGCHAGSNYTDESFRSNGIMQDDDIGRADATGRDRDFKLFKVPTLRGLKITGPFMHNGSIATLRKVIEAYNEGAPKIDVKDTDIRPLELNEQEMKDLEAFLLAL